MAGTVDKAFQVTLREKGMHGPCIVVLVVPEVDDLTVCQEDERRADLAGIG